MGCDRDTQLLGYDSERLGECLHPCIDLFIGDHEWWLDTTRESRVESTCDEDPMTEELCRDSISDLCRAEVLSDEESLPCH